jgi:hypothetical protein
MKTLSMVTKFGFRGQWNEIVAQGVTTFRTGCVAYCSIVKKISKTSKLFSLNLDQTHREKLRCALRNN